MGIDIRCDQCGKEYIVPDNWAGRRAKCPKCSLSVEVPMQVIDVEPIDEPAERPSGRASSRSDSPFQPTADQTMGGDYQSRPTAPNAALLPGARSATEITKILFRSEVILAGVGISMGLLALQLIWQIVRQGFGFHLIPVAMMLAIGAAIMINGDEMKIRYRDRSADKDQALRVLNWIFGGIAGIVLSFVAMLLFGGMGYFLPSVVAIGAPFMLVSFLVVVMSSLFLGYYILVLMFPKARVLRFAGWGYVGLTVLLPMASFTYFTYSQGLGQIGNRVAGLQVESETTVLEETPFILPPVTTRNGPRSQSETHRSTSPSGDGLAPRDRADDPSRQGRFLPPEASGSSSSGLFGPRIDPDALRRPPTGLGPGYHGSGTGQVGPGSAPGLPSAVPSHFQTLRQKIGAQIGEAVFVTIVVRNLPADKFREATQAILEIVNVQNRRHAAVMSDGVMWMSVGPVGNVETLAATLPFGKVIDIDTDRRTITVDAGSSK